MKKIIAALVVASLSSGAAMAQNMSVATFLGKAEALKKKGALALFSSDIGVLKKEGISSAAALRAERLQAVKNGQKPAFCPPEKGGSLNSEELMAHLALVPAAQRSRMSIKDGIKGLMIKKYPCR